MTVLLMAFFAVQVAVAVTWSGAGPLLGETESEQLGGALGAGVVAVTVWVAEPVCVLLSVAVTRAVYEPVLASVCVALLLVVGLDWSTQSMSALALVFCA